MTPTCDHLLLFNDPRYHALNLSGDERSARVDGTVDGRLVGTLSGVTTGDSLVCGHSAPFGGLDLVRQPEQAGAVRRCLETIVERVRRDGSRRVMIRCRPDYFGVNEPVVAFTLLSLGFQVDRVALSLGLPLDRFGDVDGYVASLRSSARRVLRHGLARDLAFACCETDAEWAAGYRVLDANRVGRGRRLSVSLDYLLRLRLVFPERIRLYRLADGDTPVAAALVYRVARDVDYVVAWGDAGHGLAHSPMNLLAFRLVEASLSAGRRLLDLGVSSVDGVADDGLVQFKRHVGAVSGLRLDLVKRL